MLRATLSERSESKGSREANIRFSAMNSNTNLKILLVYPKFPETFWSFKYALKFIIKKATNPPLGLLTVAAMLPTAWEQKLIDLNITTMEDNDLKQADYVFLSAMSIQQNSAKEIISRCRQLGVKVVAGGPLFTNNQEEFNEVDYLVLNEAELTLPRFLEDLKKGSPQHLYQTDQWANLETTPLPLWRLADIKKYASLNIQYSRGCPFNCEFCDITLLYGHRPRTKTKEQVMAELDSLYEQGWRSSVFFVDDNFIGNKDKLKKEILPAITAWQQRKKYPFTFLTQASVNLADDEELIRLMVEAGFNTVFVGIETPHEESLAECAKYQNKNRDLIANVKKIQRLGLQVQAGFILGFDSDPLSIFEKQIKFIQNSGIVTAMVGLLNALKGTKLYQRLDADRRLLAGITGNNTDFSINFIPKMNRQTLMEGYKKVLSTIYAPKYYYKRVRTFLREYQPRQKIKFKINGRELWALGKSIIYLGIIGKERFQYWKLVFWTIFTRPKLFPLAVTLSIYGFHFRKIFEKYL